MNVGKLVRMANQIAANFDYGPDKDKAVAGVVDHLSRFWTPGMHQEIIDACRRGDVELSDVAERAIARLAEERSPDVA